MIAAVVIDRLDGRHGKEPHSLTRGHTSHEECHAGSGCVEQESFHGMVVQCAKCIRNVKAMVAGVEFY